MNCLCKNMFLIYFKLYLLLIIYFVGENSVHCFSYSSLSHCNYTIDRIDAITNFTNGSLFVSSGQNYWILSPFEKPIHANAKNINEFLPAFNRVESAVNVRIKSDKENGKCVSLSEQIVFYSQDMNNSAIISTYEDQKWNTNIQLSNMELLNATKSVDWSQPIDAMAYFNNIVVIFQGEGYTSVRCENGEWNEVRHISISSTFNNIKGPIDSANFISTGSVLDDAYLYMFQSHSFFICPIFGTEPCNGPLSIVDDFFKFDKECELNPSRAESGFNWMIIALIVLILLIILLAFCCYLLILRSRQITFWVNRRRSKERDKDNVQLTYESLNGQIDAPIKGSETKAESKNGKGFDANTDDQSNMPFIDKVSSEKDEESNHQ